MNLFSPPAHRQTMEKDRILFLYSCPDGGHKKCADAVIKAIKSSTACEALGKDAITYLYPFIGPLVAKTYLEILRYTPQIWDFLYDNPDIEEVTRELRQLFNFINAPKLKYLLTEFRPTAFACTHAIPCGLIAEQKKRGNCDLPLIAIVTDYAVHSYWIHPEVDLYIVANDASKETLMARDVPTEKIKICGIPIDSSFSKKINSTDAKKKLGLDPAKPAVLIMGGARGLGPIPQMMKEILSIRGIQTLVVLGTNQGLEKELSHFKKFKHVQIHSVSKNVSLLMDAADLLITKPGGMTSSEALAKSLPMILVNPIPGQEERNANYLIQHGAAVKVKAVKELKEKTKHFLHHPHLLDLMTENCRKIAQPFSAKTAAEEILNLLDRHNTIQILKFKTESGNFLKSYVS